MDGATGQALQLAVIKPADRQVGVPLRTPGMGYSQEQVYPQGVHHPDGIQHSHGTPRGDGMLHHRVRELAWHIPWYGFKTQARIATDSGVSPSTISRLLRGHELPSLLVTLRLTQALSKRLGRPIEVGELFSLDGLYSRSICELSACRGCQTPTAFDRSDNLIPNAPSMATGQWVRPLSRKGTR